MHFHQPHVEQSHQSMPVHTKLSDIYADIQGELCSKQSTLLNKLKNSFTSLYSDLLPSHYVIVNHVLSLSDFAYGKTLTGRDLKMATQNGIIFLVKQTYLGEKIYINGLNEQQLIYQAKGKLANQGISQLSGQDKKLNTDIQKAINLANDSLALNKLYGGTILVYKTISQNAQNYREKVLLAVYLSTLIINQQLKQIGVHQIYDKLYHSNLFSVQFLQSQFMPFNKGELLITKNVSSSDNSDNESLMESFKIPNKEKLLFFHINFSTEELNNIRKHRSQIELNLIKNQQSNLNSLSELIINQTNELEHGNITLSSFINSLNKEMKLNQKIPPSLAQKQIQAEIDSIAQLIHKQPEDCLLSDSYLVFCVKSHEIHQKIRVLRKFINSQIEQNPQIVTKRFNSKKGVDKLIFSSAPSVSLAILNPQHQLWFK